MYSCSRELATCGGVGGVGVVVVVGGVGGAGRWWWEVWTCSGDGLRSQT